MRSKFEVVIYNAEVRKALKDGTRHKDLADTWADQHFIEVFATDREAARNQVMKRHPPEKGFVIVDVQQVG